jgi:hypothetical protein
MGEGSEDEADECLHCAIIDMVEERRWRSRCFEPCRFDCGELSVCHPAGAQAKLLAYPIAALGELFLQKSGEDGGGSGSTH